MNLETSGAEKPAAMAGMETERPASLLERIRKAEEYFAGKERRGAEDAKNREMKRRLKNISKKLKLMASKLIRVRSSRKEEKDGVSMPNLIFIGRPGNGARSIKQTFLILISQGRSGGIARDGSE